MTGKCRLCGHICELRGSHTVVPRFAILRLKTDSPTGHLRDGKNPNRRIQDGPKAPWLCDTCEQRFGVRESRFAQEVFHPALDLKLSSFECDDSHRYFAASLTWRNVLSFLDKIESGSMGDYTDDDIGAMRTSEKALREFLLGRTEYPERLEQHIFFAGLTDYGVPKLNVFLRCANAAWLPVLDDDMYSIVLFSSIFIVGLMSAKDETRSKWRSNTWLLPGARIPIYERQVIEDGHFGYAVIDQAQQQLIRDQTMSERQREVVRATGRAVTPQELLASPLLSAMLKDHERD